MPHDGYIYVATSDYYRANNLFKVGSTVNLDERIRKLNTGRTADDSLYYCEYWEVSYVREAERDIHDARREYRDSWNREYFQLPYRRLIRIIEEILD
ncbi:Putative MSV199 domain-containing protein 420R [Eumeta japonica]|uniref:MSV199 domain-containing protein 420R n=1 Tax=Eumeta variegata TaxID=151549 RepID=A0A4C1V349_EUMVA|nr:Putative MSV199 domain-containing protein 420R [Eumeta japonica]